MRISDWSSDVCSSDLAGLLAGASLQILPPPRSSTAFRPLRCAGGGQGRLRSLSAEPSQGGPATQAKGDNIMAITLGTFTKLDDGVFTGPLNTLNVAAEIGRPTCRERGWTSG